MTAFRPALVGAASACLLLASLGAAAWAQSAPARDAGKTAPVMRCGWFDNPTPGNASLYDKDGEWTVGIQGGRQAAGDWPTFKAAQLVKHGTGSYGFGCACLKAQVDAAEKDILAILSSQAKPLADCRRDPALKAIERQLR